MVKNSQSNWMMQHGCGVWCVVCGVEFKISGFESESTICKNTDVKISLVSSKEWGLTWCG